MKVSIDYETRSAADLKKVGAYEYSKHPSTSVLCLAWAIDSAPVRLWTPDQPPPQDLFYAIRSGATVEAWNAFFERCITKHVLPHWPQPNDSQWRCTMAKAKAFALPGKLERAALAMGSTQKDMTGHRIMLKLSKPRKPTKNNPAVWHTDPEDFATLYAYCVQDVETERSLSNALRELSPFELEVWRLDQKINLRGVRIDRALCEKALELGKRATSELSRMLADVTEGAVTKPTARSEMIRWLKARGVEPPIKINAQQEEIETTETKSLVKLLKTVEDPTVKRALELWVAANKSSVKKYAAMLQRASSEDDKVRETISYHAASTGRWGGRGIQTQNFPRPPDGMDDMDEIADDVLGRDYETISMLYGPDKVLTALSAGLRGALVASPSRVLQATDLSAVETRGAAWIAGDRELLEVFRQLDADPTANWDVYTWQASQILGREITKKDKTERQNFGKVPTLGCVYQMSYKKLITYAAGMGIELTRKQARDIVKKWRAARKPIVDFWPATEAAALEAVGRRHLKDRTVVQGRLRWKVVGRFLHCRLPSGRLLSYLDPKIENKKIIVEVEDDDGNVIETKSFWKDTLTFMGEDTYTHKWKRCSTYGGKLVENIVQALCRDLLAEAMVHQEAAGYELVLTVHDETVADVLEDFGSTEEFERLMSVVPEWADGFPIAASGGWRGQRYRK